jgi:hypothetical protein
MRICAGVSCGNNRGLRRHRVPSLMHSERAMAIVVGQLKKASRSSSAMHGWRCKVCIGLTSTAC